MFWPCETRTSTCRSFATISSGLYRFLAIAVLLDVKDIPQVGPLQWGWITIDPPEVLLAPEVSLEPTLLLRILPVQRALIHPAKLTERDVLMLSAPDALFAPGVPPRHGRFLACTAEFGPGIHNRTALV